MPVRKTVAKATKTQEEKVSAVAETASTAAERSGSTEQGRLFEEVAERVRESEAEPSPARKAAREKREQEVLQTAAAATVEAVVRDVGELRLAVNASLDTLSAALIEQAKRLAQVEEAVALKARHLAELYDIEIAADTLARLVAEHERTRRDGEEQAAARAREIDDSHAAKKADLERQASETRAGWEAEKRRWQEVFEDEKAAAKKEWAREREEYEYAWKIRRARDDEEYTAKRAALSSSLVEERARQEAQLGEREAAVIAREQAQVTLVARVEEFPAELARTVEQARQEATSSAEDKARTVAELRAKDAEAAEKLLKQRITTLEQAVKEQAGRVEELQRELREATDKVRDIAMKAIEGASGATALSRVSEIALQQAKGRGEG